eukprot:scaffold1631_cov229-Prasinococcus_capsulatus_cf.AAC.1
MHACGRGRQGSGGGSAAARAGSAVAAIPAALPVVGAGCDRCRWRGRRRIKGQGARVPARHTDLRLGNSTPNTHTTSNGERTHDVLRTGD